MCLIINNFDPRIFHSIVIMLLHCFFGGHQNERYKDNMLPSTEYAAYDQHIIEYEPFYIVLFIGVNGGFRVLVCVLCASELDVVT